MVCCSRIDISKGTDPAKSNGSIECMICHCCFFNHVLKFQDYVCHGCHNLAMLCLTFSDIAIFKGSFSLHYS